MPSQVIQTRRPAIPIPWHRLDALRGSVLDHLARIGRTLWSALEDYGRQRSAREMLALADRWQHAQPKLARELRSYVRGGSTY